MTRPAPAHYPPEQDLPTLLPLGGIAVRLGAVGSEWEAALEKAVGPRGKVIALSGGETPADCLDVLAEKERLMDLHLVIVGPLLNSMRVLRHGARALSIYGPAIALLGGPQQRDAIPLSLLQDLHYELRALPDGLTVLLPRDDG
jgi:hypothetical protein